MTLLEYGKYEKWELDNHSFFEPDKYLWQQNYHHCQHLTQEDDNASCLVWYILIAILIHIDLT